LNAKPLHSDGIKSQIIDHLIGIYPKLLLTDLPHLPEPSLAEAVAGHYAVSFASGSGGAFTMLPASAHAGFETLLNGWKQYGSVQEPPSEIAVTTRATSGYAWTSGLERLARTPGGACQQSAVHHAGDKRSATVLCHDGLR
jgi:hypothetical protein